MFVSKLACRVRPLLSVFTFRFSLSRPGYGVGIPLSTPVGAPFFSLCAGSHTHRINTFQYP